MKRLVVVDDHQSVREMVAAFLGRDFALQHAGAASTGLEAIGVCTSVRPDLVILDLTLPDLNGVEVLRRLRLAGLNCKFLIYSGTVNKQLIIEALKSKPDGFVEKCCPLSSLRDAVTTVLSGGKYFTPSAADLVFEAHGAMTTGSLTGREREILQMIAQGRSSKEIAGDLGLAVKSVDNNRVRIMEKLDIHNTARLVHYAISIGLFTLG